MSHQISPELQDTIKRFREHLTTEGGKRHLNDLKEKEPRETRAVLDKLKTLPKNSNEFVDLVLYGLLPNSDTKYAKRVSIAPSFMNIRKFFGRFNYTEDDWHALANLVFDLAFKFQQDPDHLDVYIRQFISHRLSKALQCGSLSPIFFALNPNFPIVNNREKSTYRKLSFLVFGDVDELSQRLENYLSNVDKITKITAAMSVAYKFKEIMDMAIFDLFCYWYDEQVEGEVSAIAAPSERRTLVAPVEEKYLGNFYQSIACSEPQPFYIGIADPRNLQKLDSENKIIYNTEFQRGEVWDLPRKQKLVDSILRGYNINTVFFRQLPDGKYECLDGQQRLKTLLKEFLNDEFPISPKFTPEFKREAYFSEFPEPLKLRIRSYAIFVIIFYTDKDEETCKIFLRLQEGLPLNAPEKLNAVMGLLRNKIMELSKHRFIKNLGIQDYRFAHRYMTAQIFLLTLRNQLTDVKFRNLEEMYSTYKTTRPSESVTNSVEKALNFLDKQFGEVIEFRADLVTVYLLARHLLENYAVDANLNLKEFLIPFLAKVGQVETSEGDNAPYYDYQTYRRTSADSRTSIEKRLAVILTKFLEYNQRLLPKDPKRNYEEWEKLTLYDRDKGICQICRLHTAFDKGTVDHKVPHSKGGFTTIENGQWLCVPCNLKKLDKLE
jgi:5-methylcytosine-specific restriction endonuclease McrA